MLVVFTIMLISIEEVRKKPLLRIGAGGVIGIVLTLLLLGYLVLGSFGGSLYGEKGDFTMEAIREMGPFKAVGKLFMTEYLLPFELASVVLLVGIIGAVIFSQKRRDEMIPLELYLLVSALLFGIGIIGVFDKERGHCDLHVDRDDALSGGHSACCCLEGI